MNDLNIYLIWRKSGTLYFVFSENGIQYFPTMTILKYDFMSSNGNYQDSLINFGWLVLGYCFM